MTVDEGAEGGGGFGHLMKVRRYNGIKSFNTSSNGKPRVPNAQNDS